MNEEKGGSINLSEIIKVFLQKWWLIAIAAVIGAGIMFGYTLATTEQYYRATIMMYVNSSADVQISSTHVDLSSLNASRSLVDTYSIIATTETTLAQVVEKVSTEKCIYRNENGVAKQLTLQEKYPDTDVAKLYSYGRLASNVSVKAVNETEIFSISVSTLDPEDSMALANGFLDVFPDVVKEIIKGSEAKPVQSATRAVATDRGFTKNSIIGFFVGAILSAIVIFVIDLLIDDTIDSSEWIQETFKEEVPLLTVIPDDTESSNRYGYYKNYYAYGSDKQETEGGDKQ